MTKGERIKLLRETRKITQEDLAKALNTTKQTISKYEKDIVTNIPSDRIEAIAIALETTPEYILGWEKIKKDNDNIANIVTRMRTDHEFMYVVLKVNDLEKDKLIALKQMLS